ncbi:MAG: hypothetical protein RL398_2994 [Planctomycetota bacterium]
MNMSKRSALSFLPFWLAFCATGACSFAKLPKEPPPLVDMEEPLELRAEPADEAARQALPAGGFTGLKVEDARDSLAAKLEGPTALRVAAVVENSPADAAGLLVDDVLLEVQLAAGAPQAVERPSEWRAIELAAKPGDKLTVIVDRAGREAKAELVVAARVRPESRGVAERYREEARVGVVVRTATEVEARAAGLGPGGGAVVIGLSQMSPWRRAGIRFGDLITAIDGQPITHPETLLAALRDEELERASLTVRRGTESLALEVAMSARRATLREFDVPLLFGYQSDRGKTEWSLLYGLAGYESTAAAWRFRLLWLITFGGGDADRLLEVDG